MRRAISSQAKRTPGSSSEKQLALIQGDWKSGCCSKSNFAPRSEESFIDAKHNFRIHEVQLNVSCICFDIDDFRSVTRRDRPSEDTAQADKF